MKIRVYLHTPKSSQSHAFRGIGTYIDSLCGELKKNQDIRLVDTIMEADVVHYPSFDFFFHTLPFFQSKPTVVTIHDTIPLVFPKEYPSGIKGGLRFLMQKMSLTNVRAVCTDSECSRKDIIQYLQIDSKKVHTVYLAGSPLISKTSDDACWRVQQKYEIPSRYVLYVGDMNYNKNLPRFIQACSQLSNDMHLVLVGKALQNTAIPEGRALHQAIDQYHMRERTHILTNVPKEPSVDMSAIMTGARVYIQPSLYEGFGLPVLDAMQCHVPVVCSNSSSLPEIAGDHAVYFHPQSTKEMTEKIDAVLHWSSDERKKKTTLAYEHAMQFSWKKTAEKTVAVYKAVYKKVAT